ncbi:MAG: hypothetical protein AB1650_03160 [Candidatus Omnitrophota bacterium]
MFKKNTDIPQNSRTWFWQKILLVCFSFLLTLFLIEGGLRLGGLCFSLVRDYGNRQRISGKDVIKVMCIGESTTAMGGEFSYPSQLERILNEQISHKKFHVINKGVPMTNTSIIANHIEGWIGQDMPDIAVLMIGINDHNKLIPVDMDGAKNFFSSFRVYKLYQWIAKSFIYGQRDEGQKVSRLNREDSLRMVREKTALFNEIKKAYVTGDRIGIGVVLRKIHELSVWVLDNEDLYMAVGNILLKNGWYEELPEVIDYFLDRNQHHGWLYEKIASGCRNQALKAVVVQHLMSRMETDTQNWRVLEFAGTCHALSGDHDAAHQFFEQVNQLRRQQIDSRTRQNYLRILKSLKNHDVPFILVQYPVRKIDDIKMMIQDEWDIEQIHFVDNEQRFKDAVARDGYDAYFTDRFAGDFGHGTAEGNALLASGIAESIKRFFDF